MKPDRSYLAARRQLDAMGVERFYTDCPARLLQLKQADDTPKH